VTKGTSDGPRARLFQNGTVRIAGERLYRPDQELAEEEPLGGAYGLERREGVRRARKSPRVASLSVIDGILAEL
jgi:hypothetical protein